MLVPPGRLQGAAGHSADQLPGQGDAQVAGGDHAGAGQPRGGHHLSSLDSRHCLHPLRCSLNPCCDVRSNIYNTISKIIVDLFRLEKWLSYRAMSLLGCVLIVSGVLLSSWPLLHNLYIGLGLLLGTGGCVCAITGVLQINRHFTGSDRGLAHGFSLAGNTLGGLLLPGLIALLTESYSYSGAMVILAAIILNIVPASIVFSNRVVKTQPDPDPDTKDNNNTDEQQGSKGIYSNPRLWLCIFSMASTTRSSPSLLSKMLGAKPPSSPTLHASWPYLALILPGRRMRPHASAHAHGG